MKTTWAMKTKSNGQYWAQLNACGYVQIDGVHYNEDTKAAPVVRVDNLMMPAAAKQKPMGTGEHMREHLLLTTSAS